MPLLLGFIKVNCLLDLSGGMVIFLNVLNRINLFWG